MGWGLGALLMCIICIVACEPDSLSSPPQAQKEPAVASDGAQALIVHGNCLSAAMDAFCPSPFITLPYEYEALVAGGSGDPEWAVPVVVGNRYFRVLPLLTVDSLPALVVVEGDDVWVVSGGGGQIVPDTFLDPIEDLALDQLTGLLQRNLYSTTSAYTARQQLLTEFPVDDQDQIILDNLTKAVPPTGVYGLANNCRWERLSSVGLYIDKFFQEDTDIPDVRSLVEEAYASCPLVVGSPRCPNHCIDPVCVVDYIDALPSFRVSNYTKALIKARYLASAVGTTTDFDGLALPSRSLSLGILYDEFHTFSSTCTRSSCGLQAGLRLGAAAVLEDNVVLNAAAMGSLVAVLAEMACDDPVRFECMQVRISYEMQPWLAEYASLTSSQQVVMLQMLCPELLPPNSDLHVFPIEGTEVFPLQAEPMSPGFTLVSTYAAPLQNCAGNAGGTLIAHTQGRGNVEDLTYGTTGNGTGIRFSRESTGSLTTPSSSDLLERMRTLFGRASTGSPRGTGPLQVTANQYVNNFRDNTDVSTIVSKSALNTVFAATPEFSKLVKLVADRMLGEFGDGLTSPNDLNLTLEPDQTPDFGIGPYNLLHGLTILVNNTEQSFIYLDSFEGNPEGAWSATLCFETYDHFGLDRPDITGQNLEFPKNVAARARQYIPGSDGGFAAWWVLQHQRAYIPFRTLLAAKAEIAYNPVP